MLLLTSAEDRAAPCPVYYEHLLTLSLHVGAHVSIDCKWNLLLKKSQKPPHIICKTYCSIAILWLKLIVSLDWRGGCCIFFPFASDAVFSIRSRIREQALHFFFLPAEMSLLTLRPCFPPSPSESATVTVPS